MNITREQYEADIRRAQAQALRDAAEHKTAKLPSMKAWLHARADELEGE